MAIEAEARVHAALEGIVDDEIHRGQLRQHIAPDARGPAVREHGAHFFLGHLFHQVAECLGQVGDDADVGPVALVSRTRVRHRMQRHFHESHDSATRSTRARTRARSMRMEAVPTWALMCWRTPAPPAGPEQYRLSTSSATCCAILRVGERTAARMRYSPAGAGCTRALRPRSSLSKIANVPRTS